MLCILCPRLSLRAGLELEREMADVRTASRRPLRLTRSRRERRERERERGETEERKVGDGYENKGEWEIRGDTLVLTQTQWYYSMVQFGNSLTTY